MVYSRPILMAFASILLLISCYGPPEETRVSITNGLVRPQTYTFALALHYQKYRSPEGISKFPDVGADKIVEEAALFYFINTDTNAIIKLNQQSRPDNMAPRFTPWIIGWDKEAFYFQLTSSPANRPMQIEYYRMDLDGHYEKLNQRPENLLPRPPQRIKPPLGEFLQISSTLNEIDIRTETEPYLATPIYR